MPSILNINSNNSVRSGQLNVSVTILDFINLATAVRLGGVLCTIKSQTLGDLIKIDIPGALGRGVYTLVVETLAGQEELVGVTVNSDTGIAKNLRIYSGIGVGI